MCNESTTPQEEYTHKAMKCQLLRVLPYSRSEEGRCEVFADQVQLQSFEQGGYKSHWPDQLCIIMGACVLIWAFTRPHKRLRENPVSLWSMLDKNELYASFEMFVKSLEIVVAPDAPYGTPGWLDLFCRKRCILEEESWLPRNTCCYVNVIGFFLCMIFSSLTAHHMV